MMPLIVVVVVVAAVLGVCGGGGGNDAEPLLDSAAARRHNRRVLERTATGGGVVGAGRGRWRRRTGVASHRRLRHSGVVFVFVESSDVGSPDGAVGFAVPLFRRDSVCLLL